MTADDVTADDFRLPGQRDRSSNWTCVPTTPARSWAELLETIQGGLAVVDEKCHLAFVSDRFLTLLGQPNDLAGQDLRELLPALSDDDPRELREQFESGAQIEFEQQFPTSDGNRYWYRVTMVPCAGLGDRFVAVVFAKDITETSRTLAQLRDATVGLTEVESELHRRVGRDVHDGPIQLLAALMLRLGMSNTDEADQLQPIVAEVAVTLRQVIEDFSPESRRARGTLLEQWMAPLLVDSGIELNVQDRRTAESGLAEVQAVFVMLYQTIRGVSDPALRRTINVDMTNERGGERIVLTTLSTQPVPLSGRRAARFRSITHHVRSLGGTLSAWLDDDDVRTFSMWIPTLARTTEPPATEVTGLNRASDVPSQRGMSPLQPLSDSTWRKIVSEAPERMIEFDAQMRISFANAAQQATIGLAPDQLIGLSAEQMFSADSLAQLADAFDRLDAGEFVETDWYRNNWLGDSRLIHLTLSPRLDEANQWQGLFLATEDQTDLELIDDLYQTALADLTLARRRAVEASVQRLEQPLAKCEQLIEDIERSGSHPAPVRNIAIELAVALRKIKSSTSMLVAPALSINDLDHALRESLGAILVGRRLVVVDNTGSPLPAEISDVVFRIAREAVNNAVLHGDAGSITVTLSDASDGTNCTIHDDGIGVNTDQLQHQPGHLGTRAMQERARERGGTCRIEPDPRGGTLVSAWLPNHTDRPSLLHGTSTAL